MRSNFATMTDREVSSFVTKFGDLLHAGLRASLVMECDNGNARVNLEVLLQPDHHQPHHSRAGHHQHSVGRPRHPADRTCHPSQHPAGRPRHPPHHPADRAGHPPGHPDGRAGPSRRRRREHRQMARRLVGQAAASAAQAGPEHPPHLQAGPKRVPVSPHHNGSDNQPAVQVSHHLPPEHVSPLPLLPPYLLHTWSPPPVEQQRQKYRADLSSFCFLSSDPSQHPPPSSTRRRVPSSRPDPRDSLCEIRKPEKYLKVLLSQNIQRAIGNSGEGCVGWVREVSVFRMSNFVDKEMMESLPHLTSLAALGPLPPQGQEGAPLPYHAVPLPPAHHAETSCCSSSCLPCCTRTSPSSTWPRGSFPSSPCWPPSRRTTT